MRRVGGGRLQEFRVRGSKRHHESLDTYVKRQSKATRRTISSVGVCINKKTTRLTLVQLFIDGYLTDTHLQLLTHALTHLH